MLSSEPRARMSSIASTVFGDSLEQASVMARLLTAEKSLSDWAELRCRGCAWQQTPALFI